MLPEGSPVLLKSPWSWILSTMMRLMVGSHSARSQPQQSVVGTHEAKVWGLSKECLISRRTFLSRGLQRSAKNDGASKDRNRRRDKVRGERRVVVVLVLFMFVFSVWAYPHLNRHRKLSNIYYWIYDYGIFKDPRLLLSLDANEYADVIMITKIGYGDILKNGVLFRWIAKKFH